LNRYLTTRDVKRRVSKIYRSFVLVAVTLLTLVDLPRVTITPVESAEETPVTPASSKPKLKARLGETQIVEFSDDEDDADLVGRDDDDTAGDASDPDFLKEYPDETDVSRVAF
jgi:hypothetical protein